MTMLAEYEPPATGEWARLAPAAAGFDAGALADAVAFAEANETPWERDLARQIGQGHFEPPPWNEIIGPTRARGGPAGLVLRGGRVVASWGDPARADMTFSASKSYLSLCAGLAFDDGLLPDPCTPVRDLVDDGGFDPPHNAAIQWHHLLQLTSEWEGELWGKPDLVDRNRDLALEGLNADKGKARPLQAPGTHWEYNDVRVNRLALSLLRLWRRGLPDLLRERIMDPIGASRTWEWHGYRNSFVDIDGHQVQSVSGGGHWGGGLFISSWDHARVGLLMLRDGRWGGRQLVSREWIARSLTPCMLKPTYGYMWWLNTGRLLQPSAPASGFAAVGAGSNIVWVDRESDVVVVARWIAKDKVDGLLGRVHAALRS
ncbi:MAG: serine hydrolase domain-containing protein [Alphaproteobacteria bacterium]